MTDASDASTKEPCGNEDCDACYPLPRFKISAERVQRLFYEREIKAPDEATALRLYAEPTAWPSSYDDRHGEILDQKEPVVARQPAQLQEWRCYHNLDARAARSKANDEALGLVSDERPKIVD